MKHRVAAWIGIWALAGCTAPALQTAGSYPADYKKLAADQLREDFPDPYTLRDVWISAPVEGQMRFNLGWIVCVRATGRDEAGQYGGRREIAYLLNKGIVLEKGPDPSCAAAPYAPWPEMTMSGSAAGAK